MATATSGDKLIYKNFLMMFLTEKHKNILTRITKYLIVTVAIISVFKGLQNAWFNQIDFQQPAAKLFISGVDPYEAHLSNEHPDVWSPPNYLHVLYFIQSPLTIFNDSTARLIWALFNTLLCYQIVKLLSNEMLNRKLNIIMLAIICASTPWRNGIGNSQNQILVLWLITHYYYSQHSVKRVFAGATALFKYSFAPIIFGLEANNWRGFVKIVVLLSLYTLLGSLWIYDHSFIQSALGPVLVSSTNVSPGYGDILTILDQNLNLFSYRTYYGILLLFANSFAIFLYSKSNSNKHNIFAFSCTSSLAFITHLGYDYVFLIPSFIYLIGVRTSVTRNLGLLLLFYFGFGTKFLSFIGIEIYPKLISLNFLFLCLIMCMIYLDNRRISPIKIFQIKPKSYYKHP